MGIKVFLLQQIKVNLKGTFISNSYYHNHSTALKPL